MHYIHGHVDKVGRKIDKKDNIKKNRNIEREYINVSQLYKVSFYSNKAVGNVWILVSHMNGLYVIKNL